MSTPAFVLVGVAILALAALLVASLLRWLTRMATRNRTRLDDVLSVEPAVRGPERASYRGSTGGYSRVSATGLIALTERTLLFRKTTGGAVDVPLAAISGVRLSRQFTRRRFGPLLLVVQAHLGEVVYLVSDPEGWRDAIRRAVTGSMQQPG
jgi:hypothetical protein